MHTADSECLFYPVDMKGAHVLESKSAPRRQRGLQQVVLPKTRVRGFLAGQKPGVEQAERVNEAIPHIA